MVSEREITELIRYDMYHVKEVKTKTLPISVLINKIIHVLQDSFSVTGVTISNNPLRPYKVKIPAPHKAGIMTEQYSGEVLGMD